MVLKRIFVTALSAVGLGALAAGSASAQQIPAPDAYGDSLDCQNGIPVIKTKASKDHPLDKAIESGTLSVGQIATLTAMARACGDDPVGGGIAEVRDLYEMVTDAKEDLDAAQEAYDDDDSAGNKEDLDEAVAAHKMAVDARNAYVGGGALYESVLAEEDEKADAVAAHTAWMKAYTAEQKAEDVKDSVTADEFISSFAGFDSDGNPLTFEVYERKAIDHDDDGNNDVEAGTYVRVKKADGTYIGTNDEGDPTMTTVRVFDHDDALSGELGNIGTAQTLEVESWDHDGDADTDMMSIVTLDQAGRDAVLVDDVMFGAERNGDGDIITHGVDSRYEAAMKALEDATEAVDNNRDGTQTDRLAEEKRRAQARYDHFKAQRDAAYDDLRKGRLKYLGDNPGNRRDGRQLRTHLHGRRLRRPRGLAG